MRGQSLKTKTHFLSRLELTMSLFYFRTEYFKNSSCVAEERDKLDPYIHSCISYSSFCKAVLFFLT